MFYRNHFEMSAMIELLTTLSFKKSIFYILMAFSILLNASSINAAEVNAGIPVSQALKTAQAHIPGKLVAHEEASELISYPEKSSVKSSQPVYRIKILSTQGIMKTILVHRKTGQVVE